ncbi:MAG: hypothetical protein MJ082_02260 [Clostridia bacterium]|nr:hypothetical protein [Clostridia bacterium]
MERTLDAFFNWFFAFITEMFANIWSGIVSLLRGIVKIFDFGTYFGLLANYSSGFGFIGWILAVLTFILVYLFFAGVIFLIVLMVRREIRHRNSISQNDDLLDEIAGLHKEVDRLVMEKERILDMKSLTGGYTPELASGEPASIFNPDGTPAADTEPESREKRFFILDRIDEKYISYVNPGYDDTLSLAEICEDFRNFACFNSHLFYEIKTIRLVFAGLSTTKMLILQGISGTGKTSLPYCMGKYFESPTTIASVQPSWKERSELFGFFNEFTKKFNETEVLARIYESSYTDDVNVIVLDEMNIARVEYYFAEMLSVLELPDANSRQIQLVPSVWENDPKHLDNGRIHIPENLWYVGTANNDDSTFSISDKVYDRAFIVNLDSKGVPFEAPETFSRRVSYSHIQKLYDEALRNSPMSEELLGKIEQLDSYVIEHFRVAFGNRILKQISTFVPVYAACGGTEIEGLDYMLATKVFRKFEGLNLVLVRDEIKGLINTLDALFGKDAMTECITFLRRLQKSY